MSAAGEIPEFHKKLFEAKQALWRYVHAQQCFEYVIRTAAHVEAEKWDDNHPLIYQMSVAIVVLYSRPFTNCWGLGQLPVSLVPSELLHRHEKIMVLRNKVFAHHDVTGSPELAAHNLEIGLRLNLSGGEAHIELIEQPLKDAAFDQMGKLATILEEKCRWHVDKIGRRYKGRMPKKTGIYNLDLSPLSEDFFASS